MTIDLAELAQKILKDEIDPVIGINSILDNYSGSDDKLVKEIYQSAREVLHFTEKYKSAETDQWRQSFAFEVNSSQKRLVKALKKACK